MNEAQIEQLLRGVPSPTVPNDLFDTLSRQIRLQPSPEGLHLQPSWRRVLDWAVSTAVVATALAFLLGLTLPDEITKPAQLWLARYSTLMAATILSLLGVTIVGHGPVVLSVPDSGLNLEMASSCINIHHLVALFLFTFLIGSWCLHSVWRRLILLGAAVILACFKPLLQLLFTFGYLFQQPQFSGNIPGAALSVTAMTVVVALLALLLAALRRSERSQIHPPT